MPALLTAASSLACPHGGTVTGTPGETRASADDTLLRAGDSFSIDGCTFNISGAAQPCTTVVWVITAERVKHGGDFVLNESSVGLCMGPAPQGTVIVSDTQATVAGL